MPLKRANLSGTAIETTPGTGATSKPVTLTAAGTNNTKGAYAELITATDFDANWLTVHIGFTNASGRYLVDIATGGSGSESVLIPNLHYANRIGLPGVGFQFPIFIPVGTRISARCQCSTLSQTIDCWVSIGKTPIPITATPTSALNYGAATADSGLTSVDPGGTANTEGSYVQLTASTTNPISWLMLLVGGDTATRGATNMQWLFDIATGAAASEVNLISDIAIMEDGSSDSIGPTGMIFPVQIAAGTRLSARCQCSVNTATERLVDVAVIGLT